MNPYSSLICDDFGIYVYANTKMELPTRRETVLHFFDTVRKMYPKMTEFDTRESGEYVLEEDREEGTYRWAALEPRRFSSGIYNPESIEDADAFHQRILEVAPYHLDFHLLDCSALDVMFAFDLNCSGNHDEVVTEALGLHPALENLLGNTHAKVLDYQPSLMISLDESCRLQGRLHIETRTNPYQVRTNQYSDLPITVYFRLRQYWDGQTISSLNEAATEDRLPSLNAGKPEDVVAALQEAYRNQRRLCQEIVDEHIVPAILQPLSQTIKAR